MADAHVSIARRRSWPPRGRRRALPILLRTGAAALGSTVAGLGYAAIIERNAFVLREITMPVLSPGSTPLRVLHISDLHMTPGQRRKQAWLRELAGWEPDLVVNTGDNLAHPKAVPAVIQALGDLLSRPGVFVFGSNDYFGPHLKNPLNYVTNPSHRVRGEPLPWQDLRAAFTERGWLDLTHTRREFEVAGLHVAAAGVDDPHIDRGAGQPGGQPAAGADAFAGAAGAGPVRRRRLPTGDGRAHPRRPGVPAVLRGAGDQLRAGPLAREGAVPLGRAHAAARLRGHGHLAVRAGAVLLPAGGHPADADRHPDGRPRRGQRPEPFAANSFGAVTRTRIAVRNLPRDWTDNAIRLIQADARRSADTHLLRYPLPSAWAGDADVALYLKDETTHVTGSLKHRLARSLFLYALCNGWIGEGTTVVEASSGSTAVSEAYFAALLGLPFVAVMPESTSAAKVALIESQGGRCHFVADSSQVYAEAERVARQTGGHYLDQFTNAERATDWRGNNNIAESIFEQMRDEKHPVPAWIVVGAGTGGTSATIGRYIRYRRHATRLCVVDPEHSAFFAAYAEGRDDVVASRSSRIEGIGRPRVEPSFLPCVVDRMVAVLGRLGLLAELVSQGRGGSVVTLLADSGDRYADTYFDDEWVAAQGLDPAGSAAALAEFERSCAWQ